MILFLQSGFRVTDMGSSEISVFSCRGNMWCGEQQCKPLLAAVTSGGLAALAGCHCPSEVVPSIKLVW